MARYSYKAIDKTGKTVSGVLAAPSASAAHLMVLARGLQPISVEEKTSVLQYEVTKKKVPREEVMHFSRQLGVFVKAGIPILDSLEIIEGETTNKLFKKVLDTNGRGPRRRRHFRPGGRGPPGGVPRRTTSGCSRRPSSPGTSTSC